MSRILLEVIAMRHSLKHYSLIGLALLSEFAIAFLFVSNGLLSWYGFIALGCLLFAVTYDHTRAA